MASVQFFTLDMDIFPMHDRQQETTDRPDTALGNIVHRLKRLCAEQGWDRGQLARRAGVSRTTLYHLLHGQTSRPRGSTLGRLATALGTSVADLERTPASRQQPVQPAQPPESPARRDRKHIFARSANHCVIDVCEESPELFSGWSEQQWDELYSVAGSVPRLNPAEVRRIAARINARRQTLNRLRTVLSTHLEPVATGMIDTLYHMLDDAAADSPEERPSGIDSTCE